MKELCEEGVLHLKGRSICIGKVLMVQLALTLACVPVFFVTGFLVFSRSSPVSTFN